MMMGLAEGPEVGEVREVTQCSSHLTVCQQEPGREDACVDRKEDPRTAVRCQGWGRGQVWFMGPVHRPSPGEEEQVCRKRWRDLAHKLGHGVKSLQLLSV